MNPHWFCSQENRVVFFFGCLACVGCFGAEGIRPDPPPCTAVRAGCSTAWSRQSVQAKERRTHELSKLLLLLERVHSFSCVGARAGPHYLCIHLCSHWNNSRVPAASLTPYGGREGGRQHHSRSATFLIQWDVPLKRNRRTGLLLHGCWS